MDKEEQKTSIDSFLHFFTLYGYCNDSVQMKTFFLQINVFCWNTSCISSFLFILFILSKLCTLSNSSVSTKIYCIVVPMQLERAKRHLRKMFGRVGWQLLVVGWILARDQKKVRIKAEDVKCRCPSTWVPPEPWAPNQKPANSHLIKFDQWDVEQSFIENKHGTMGIESKAPPGDAGGREAGRSQTLQVWLTNPLQCQCTGKAFRPGAKKM